MPTSNGPAIRAIREAQGWKGVTFAKAVGISHGHLFNIENPERNKHASPATLRKMADVLDVPLAALCSDYTVEQIAGKRHTTRKPPETPEAA
jgi:transcriptional regulator with XRE-family HTH domain